MNEQKSNRGFASMDKEKHREICVRGGKAAHTMNKAHKFTSEEGKREGTKGGNKVKAKYGNQHFVEMGRRGAAKRLENQRLRELEKANEGLSERGE